MKFASKTRLGGIANAPAGRNTFRIIVIGWVQVLCLGNNRRMRGVGQGLAKKTMR